jgi:hypothetical protein
LYFQKQQYLAETPQHRQIAKDLALSDDEYIMGPEKGSSRVADQSKSCEGQPRRGRPRKEDAQNSKAPTKPVSQKSVKPSVLRARGENKRVSNPSQYQLSPYK